MFFYSPSAKRLFISTSCVFIANSAILNVFLRPYLLRGEMPCGGGPWAGGRVGGAGAWRGRPRRGTGRRAGAPRGRATRRRARRRGQKSRDDRRAYKACRDNTEKLALRVLSVAHSGHFFHSGQTAHMRDKKHSSIHTNQSLYSRPHHSRLRHCSSHHLVSATCRQACLA